jgi:hypothetical protein
VPSSAAQVTDVRSVRAALCRTLTDACWCAQWTFRHTF